MVGPAITFHISQKHAFFTIGTAGGASWQHTDAVTYTQNGSWVQGTWVPGDPKTYTQAGASSER